MRSSVLEVLLGCVLALSFAAAEAQGVYVIQGEKGPVFSNVREAGAKEVVLRPLSVIPSEKEAKKGGEALSKGSGASSKSSGTTPNPAGREDPDPGYSAFRILLPEEGGSVIANTGVLEVRLEAEPPLRIGEGHAFSVRINGRQVAQRFTANEFVIPPESWAEAPFPANQMAQLDASIVDGAGRVLRQAASVRFSMRYTTVLNRPHRLVPVVPQHHERPGDKKSDAAAGSQSGVGGVFLKR